MVKTKQAVGHCIWEVREDEDAIKRLEKESALEIKNVT